MKPTSFFSCGKVMLTGEYAVLEGAACLSFPSRLGQTLTVEAHPGEGMEAVSLEANGQPWLRATFDLTGRLTAGPEAASRLEGLFQQALLMRGSDKLPPSKLTFQSEFDRSWGLGSSSTLVHLVAQWLEVDPMVLFRATDSGSGYDLATALAGRPIIYQLHHGKAEWNAVPIHWTFTDHLWLVPLGKKQRSDVEVKKFKERGNADPVILQAISAITLQMAEATSVEDFKELMAKHETAVGRLIGKLPVQSTFKGAEAVALKSLGAWGGDLVLAVGHEQDVVRFSQLNALGKPQPFGEVVVI